jgi:hypothetical protein
MEFTNKIDTFDLLEEVICFESNISNITDSARQTAMQKGEFNINDYRLSLRRLLQEHIRNLQKFSSNNEKTGQLISRSGNFY